MQNASISIFWCSINNKIKKKNTRFNRDILFRHFKTRSWLEIIGIVAVLKPCYTVIIGSFFKYSYCGALGKCGLTLTYILYRYIIVINFFSLNRDTLKLQETTLYILLIKYLTNTFTFFVSILPNMFTSYRNKIPAQTIFFLIYL